MREIVIHSMRVDHSQDKDDGTAKDNVRKPRSSPLDSPAGNHIVGKNTSSLDSQTVAQNSLFLNIPSNSSGWTPPTRVNLAHPFGLSFEPPRPISLEPLFFVTEPNDSPKAQSPISEPNSFIDADTPPFLNPLPLPKPSPLPSLSARHQPFLLPSTEDYPISPLSSPKKPCSPNLNDALPHSPAISQPKNSSRSRIPKRKPLSHKPPLKKLSTKKDGTDGSLFEVQILQGEASFMEEDREVSPATVYPHKASSDERAVVAGPQQPHPQC
ncbi:hypothetical protein RHSIM_RhsimUnG0155000 [Rhododendron simsii]|uniref:Uncharacterized protein n=1 Tax=Rhododendron simsii TaxID=118357 RepID=A0A834FU54_RHOSS|nr:hypothetical protein RHSIM_RhsimUnG0155000 [Rhododendron simsii]